MIDQPIFCITSDIDWASEYCIKDFLGLMQDFEITPTLFATHESPAVRRFIEGNTDNVGVHPNFRSDSTHGKDYLSVIEHVFQLYPKAKTFRSHALFDSSDILQEMSKRGIKYDSNLCLYLQPNIVPLRLGIPKITRFPVFWDDSSHLIQSGGDWQVEHYFNAFNSPGLKIINVHPFAISANVCSRDNYLRVKKYITIASSKDIETHRHKGKGARTFLIELIEFILLRGMRFYTLDEIYRMFPIEDFLEDIYATLRRRNSYNGSNN